MCHGKCTPLSRVRVGDGIVYYSSVERFGTKDKCQRFTAIGSATPTDVSAPADAKPYQVAISPGAPSMRLARVLGGVVGEANGPCTCHAKTLSASGTARSLDLQDSNPSASIFSSTRSSRHAHRAADSVPDLHQGQAKVGSAVPVRFPRTTSRGLCID